MAAREPGDPEQVGAYRVLGRLGSGGTGRVFLGQSPGGRLVAVKLVRADLAAEESFRVRFAREVGAARKVSGMFTAPLIDADPQAPLPWLVTAYVPALSLADAVAAHGPLPAASVMRLAAGLAEGLGAIHAAGVVHRDLKPSNVLLAADGPRIIDFGVSQAADATALTRTEVVIGSPAFMSPEQAEGGSTGPASDVFSLGSLLVFAATGESPFGTGPAAALLYRVVHSQPAMAGLPGGLRSLAERCLAKDASRRLTTGQILAAVGNLPQAGRDWLPASISHALPAYQVPGLPAAGLAQSPVPQASADPESPTMPGGRTAADHNADSPQTVEATVVRQQNAPAQPSRRGRWGLWTWAAGALAAVVVATVGTAVTLTAHRSPPSRRGFPPGHSHVLARTHAASSKTQLPARASQQPPGRHAGTRVVVYQPWTPSGLAHGVKVSATVSGSCWTSSSAAPGRSDAYRCMEGNYLLDPCFASPYAGASAVQVACTYPAPDAITVINLTQRLPSPLPPGSQSPGSLSSAAASDVSP